MGTQVYWASWVNSSSTLRSLIKAQFHGETAGCRPSCMLLPDSRCLWGTYEWGQTSRPRDAECALGQGAPENTGRRSQGWDRQRVMPPSLGHLPSSQPHTGFTGIKTQAPNLAKIQETIVYPEKHSSGSELLKYLRGSRSKWGMSWRTQGSIFKCLTPTPDSGFLRELGHLWLLAAFSLQKPFKECIAYIGNKTEPRFLTLAPAVWLQKNHKCSFSEAQGDTVLSELF